MTERCLCGTFVSTLRARWASIWGMRGKCDTCMKKAAMTRRLKRAIDRRFGHAQLRRQGR